MRVRRAICSSMLRPWFRATIQKACHFCSVVGCLGIGWILWRWEKLGAITSSDAKRKAGTQ